LLLKKPAHVQSRGPEMVLLEELQHRTRLLIEAHDPVIVA
jgi:hypothetical protein